MWNDEQFDEDFHKATKWGMRAGCLVLILSAAFTIAVIWGIVTLVKAHSAVVPPALHGSVGHATTNTCRFNDGSPGDCHWNAKKQGDGLGHSFYRVRVGNKDCFIYWADQFNRQNGHCVPAGSGRGVPRG